MLSVIDREGRVVGRLSPADEAAMLAAFATSGATAEARTRGADVVRTAQQRDCWFRCDCLGAADAAPPMAFHALSRAEPSPSPPVLIPVTETHIRLRPDARFASGSPVTAEDAAFSLQRAVMLDKAPASIISQFGFTRDNVAERIRAEDDRTLVLRLAERKAPSFLLYCLSAAVGGIVEKKAVLAHQQGNDLGNAWLRTNSAGSGNWVVRSWRPSESVTLDASPNAGSAIRRLLIRHVADPSAQLLLLRGGDADIARNLTADQLHSLASTPGYTTSAQGRAMLMYVAMNQQHPELARPGVRQAIKWALDYEAIQRNIVPTTYRVHQAFLPQGFPAALNELPFHKDPARAKALLAEAGLAGGFEVTMDHQSAAPHSDIAQAVQADLGQVGIRVRLLAAEGRQVITKTRARQHQLALLTWGSDYFDPEANAGTFCVNTDNSPEARPHAGLALRLAGPGADRASGGKRVRTRCGATAGALWADAARAHGAQPVRDHAATD